MPYYTVVNSFAERMKKNALTIVGALAGAFLGLLYWSRVGCSNDHCVIASNPYISTAYGGLFLGLIANEISRTRNKQKQKQKTQQ